MELLSRILVSGMGLRSKEEEIGLNPQHAGIDLQIGDSEAVESGSTVNLAVLEAIDTKLHQQVLMEVPRVQESIPRIVHRIDRECQFGPEGSGGDLGDVEADGFDAAGLVEVDDVAVGMGSELL
jgi:hypothetical protein